MPYINQDLKLKTDPTTIVYPNINSASIPAGAVVNAKIADGAVTQAKLGDGSVITAKIAANGVTSTNIATSAVTTSKLASYSVITSKLADGAVTSAKIADGAIVNSKIGQREIGSTNIRLGGVLRENLDTAAVGKTQLYLSSASSLSAVASDFDTWADFLAFFGDPAEAFGIRLFIETVDGAKGECHFAVANSKLVIHYVDSTLAMVSTAFSDVTDISAFEGLGNAFTFMYLEG